MRCALEASLSAWSKISSLMLKNNVSHTRWKPVLDQRSIPISLLAHNDEYDGVVFVQFRVDWQVLNYMWDFTNESGLEFDNSSASHSHLSIDLKGRSEFENESRHSSFEPGLQDAASEDHSTWSTSCVTGLLASTNQLQPFLMKTFWYSTDRILH